MKVELISVGSELISGKVINTNASYISQKLLELGHTQTRQFTVDDNIARISELVKSSLDNCEVLIVTGGLGPTDDDITKEAVCKALDIRLVENKKCKEHIEKHFAMLGRTPTQNNYKQALAPEYAEIFKNDCGTACGFGIGGIPQLHAPARRCDGQSGCTPWSSNGSREVEREHRYPLR